MSPWHLRRCKRNGNQFRRISKAPRKSSQPPALAKVWSEISFLNGWRCSSRRSPRSGRLSRNRPRLIAFAFVLGVLAGLGGIFAVEAFDRTLRNSNDLISVAGGHAVVLIPYISTKSELVRRRGRVLAVTGALVLALAAGAVAVHTFLRPLDEIWTILIDRLLASWSF